VLVSSEGLRPSDSPARALARRFAGALRARGSLAVARSRRRQRARGGWSDGFRNMTLPLLLAAALWQGAPAKADVAGRSDGAKADLVVAADGSGQYRTIQEAINAVPQDTSAAKRCVIFVKAGTYRELVYVQREKRFVSLVGEDPARTIVTYNLKAG